MWHHMLQKLLSDVSEDDIASSFWIKQQARRHSIILKFNRMSFISTYIALWITNSVCVLHVMYSSECSINLVLPISWRFTNLTNCSFPYILHFNMTIEFFCKPFIIWIMPINKISQIQVKLNNILDSELQHKIMFFQHKNYVKFTPL